MINNTRYPRAMKQLRTIRARGIIHMYAQEPSSDTPLCDASVNAFIQSLFIGYEAWSSSDGYQNIYSYQAGANSEGHKNMYIGYLWKWYERNTKQSKVCLLLIYEHVSKGT